MISIFDRKFNHYVQLDFYYTYINTLVTGLVTCPKCNCDGYCVKHGYYTRHYIHNNNVCKINILRIRCKKCGSTHGILPVFLLPYFQIVLVDILRILHLDSKDQYSRFFADNYLFEEVHIYSIKKRFQSLKHKTQKMTKEVYEKMVNHLELVIPFLLHPLSTILL